MHSKRSKNHSGKLRRFLLRSHRYLGVTKSFVRSCMTIQAARDHKIVAFSTENMVTTNSARTHQKGIDEPAVDAARLLCSERFRCLGRSPRCAGRIARELHDRGFVAVFSHFRHRPQSARGIALRRRSGHCIFVTITRPRRTPFPCTPSLRR